MPSERGTQREEEEEGGGGTEDGREDNKIDKGEIAGRKTGLKRSVGEEGGGHGPGWLRKDERERMRELETQPRRRHDKKEKKEPPSRGKSTT